MEAKARINGLDGVLKALDAAFPDNVKKQSQLINGAMGGAARKTFLPTAKQFAKHADSSGALAESLAVRAQPAKRRKGKAGGMYVLPVRHNAKAMAMYISHYYTSRGKTPPMSIVDSGIRHGHLVEFGTAASEKHAATPAQSFLWASTVRMREYASLFGAEIRRRIELAVRREAKKKAKK